MPWFKPIQVNNGGGGSVPSNVILFEDWIEGEQVIIDTSPSVPNDVTAPTLMITPGGTFTGTKTVSMSVNETADIFYTLDGSIPTTNSTKYTAPLSISTTTKLKGFARDSVGNVSAVQTVTYTLDTTAPVDTTAPDNVTNLQATPTANSVALSWTASTSSDVASYDIFNGSTLIANVTDTTYNVTGLSASTAYTFTVNAKDGANNVASGTSVTVTTSAPVDTTAPVLTITPAATFSDTQTVTMSINETGTIWYTVDGSDPVTSGTRVQYTAPVTLAATTTVKAFAVDTAGNTSIVQTVTYAKETVSTGGYVTNGLQIYYDFASLSETPATITDSSGNGNDGTLTGYTGGLESGIKNGELIGSGNGERIRIPQKTSLKTYPYTLEYYASFRDRYLSPINEARIFDTRYGTGTGNGVSTVLRNSSHASPNSIQLTGSLGTPTYTVNQPTIDNVYRHIVIVWGQSSQKIYVDNVLIGTSTSSSTSLGDRELQIFGIDGGTIAHAARLFRFYNRELTATEIQQNFNSLPTNFTPADVIYPTITATPAPGAISTTIAVTLTTDEPATIYYTLDGSAPTEASTQYASSINVIPGQTVKAIAKDSAGNVSKMFAFSYPA